MTVTFVVSVKHVSGASFQHEDAHCGQSSLICVILCFLQVLSSPLPPPHLHQEKSFIGGPEGQHLGKKCSVADPGSSAFLTPWIRIRDGKKSGSQVYELSNNFFGLKY